MPHIHERYDFTVGVFVVYKNTVLLRKHDKYKIWMGVGGHIELDEDPIQAAIRETKEESGLDVVIVGEKTNINWASEGYRELLPPRFLYVHAIDNHHEHINFIYFGKTENNAVSQGEDEVSEEMRWFTKDDLENPTFNISLPMKHFAKKALETVA